jgi:hypothetical protein
MKPRLAEIFHNPSSATSRAGDVRAGRVMRLCGRVPRVARAIGRVVPARADDDDGIAIFASHHRLARVVWRAR